MTSDLLRQRRNLIAISSVLLIFDFADVTIGKVSVLGAEILVGNVKVLSYCAWGLWAYFFLRYYQYWRNESPLIRETFKRRVDHYARSYTKVKPVQTSSGSTSDNYGFVRTGRTDWSYQLVGYSPAQLKEFGVVPIPISGWRLVLWSVRAVLFISLDTIHATDHVLPFVLGFAAPVVAFFTKWQLW
jgi:hypothetical protein